MTSGDHEISGPVGDHEISGPVLSRRHLLGIGVAAVPAVVLLGAASVDASDAAAGTRPLRPAAAADATLPTSQYVYFC